jgi:4-aminobutyrate aminotransferase-like enzyme
VKSRTTLFKPVRFSLKSLLGGDYVDAVCAARAFLCADDVKPLRALAARKVDLYPKAFQRRLLALLPRIGEAVTPPLSGSAQGATTTAFHGNAHATASPLGGLGFYRVGENGNLFLATKSEHYHLSVGHGFPGFALVDLARRLGVPNATHNNTRGHITRLLEEELVRWGAGLALGERSALDRIVASKRGAKLNRVLNLQTGSLAAEAALKLVLARFFTPQQGAPSPKYAGRCPVVLVVGDDQGDPHANYHGTTVLTQIMRGMWPEIGEGLARRNVFKVTCIRPNSLEDLEAAFVENDTAPNKIAAFFHELVLMNYGATRLTERFVKRAYALCKKYDVPTVVDEIQTCVWSPELYMFREYGVTPSVVVLGKGCSGGEYAASRLLFDHRLDTLPQFGALVTNGQEELSSLSYLVTMRWAEANAAVTREVGEYYEERLKALAEKHPRLISAVEGRRHMAGIYFDDLNAAKKFTRRLSDRGLDISVQTYKEGCPPSALTKLPLIAGYEVVDVVVKMMDEALGGL